MKWQINRVGCAICVWLFLSVGCVAALAGDFGVATPCFGVSFLSWVLFDVLEDKR